MNIEERVRQLVEEKISDRPELFIVDITMLPAGKLVVLLDGDRGIDIKDCAAVSRYVGFHLEEENAIEQAYTLEVSSPGIDMPLNSLRQYRKNLNRNLSVKLSDKTIREGQLTDANDTGITLITNNKTKGQKAQTIESFIPFDQIVETKVLISFK